MIHPLPQFLARAINSAKPLDIWMPDKFNLSDIEIHRLTLVKEVYLWHQDQDHSRWVFKCSQRNYVKDCRYLYFKIWNPDYVRRDNILMAMDAGFFDDKTTPALKGIIYHQGLCRGYIMEECKQIYTHHLNQKYFELIKTRSRETGLFHIQFSPCHVMKYKRWFSLIDLEGVFKISEFPHLHKMKSYFDYKDYEKFIEHEYRRLIGAGEHDEIDEGYKNKAYFRQINPLLRLSKSIYCNIVDYCKKTDGKNLHMIEI